MPPIPPFKGTISTTIDMFTNLEFGPKFGLWIQLWMWNLTKLPGTLKRIQQVNAPEKWARAPIGKDRLPTIHFQGQAVSFREGTVSFFFNSSKLPSGFQTLHGVAERQ